jgi:hypothetical protein
MGATLPCNNGSDEWAAVVVKPTGEWNLTQSSLSGHEGCHLTGRFGLDVTGDGAEERASRRIREHRFVSLLGTSAIVVDDYQRLECTKSVVFSYTV